MNNTFYAKFLFFGIVFMSLGLFSTSTPAKAIDYWLIPLDMVAPPNAIMTYLYGTPVYPVPQYDLHRATYDLGGGHILNYYAFYYTVPEKVYPIGIDETGEFLLVMVESSGQIGWVPKIQIYDKTLSTDGMRVFKMNNMPDYYNIYR